MRRTLLVLLAAAGPWIAASPARGGAAAPEPSPAAAPAGADAPDPAPTPQPISAAALPGWASAPEPRAAEAAPPPDGALPLAGVALPPRTGVRLESAFVVGGPVEPFGALALRVQVRTDEDGAWGLVVPVVLAADNPRVAGAGSIGVERLWRFGRSVRGAPATFAALRLLLPASTNARWFVDVPGRELLGIGLEGAYAVHDTLGPFEVHGEATLGMYGQALMPLRLSLTGVASWQAAGPLHLFAQVDPWLVWVPTMQADADPWSNADRTEPLGQLGLAAGLEGRFGPLCVTLAYQRVFNHAPDHHLRLTVDLPLR